MSTIYTQNTILFSSVPMFTLMRAKLFKKNKLYVSEYGTSSRIHKRGMESNKFGIQSN